MFIWTSQRSEQVFSLNCFRNSTVTCKNRMFICLVSSRVLSVRHSMLVLAFSLSHFYLFSPNGRKITEEKKFLFIQHMVQQCEYFERVNCFVWLPYILKVLFRSSNCSLWVNQCSVPCIILHLVNWMDTNVTCSDGENIRWTITIRFYVFMLFSTCSNSFGKGSWIDFFVSYADC